MDDATDFNYHFFNYNSLDNSTNKKGKLIVDKMFRYENINNEIRTIVNQFNIPLKEIPNLNLTTKKRL